MPAPTVLTPVGPVRMKSAALELVTELMVRSIEPVLVIVIVWAADAVLTRVSAKLSEPPAGVVSEIVGSTPVPDTGTSVVPSTRSLVRTAMVPVRDPVAVGWKTTLTVTSVPAGTVRAHGAGVQVTRKSPELLVIELMTRGAVVAPALLRMRKVWAALGVPTRVLGNARHRQVEVLLVGGRAVAGEHDDLGRERIIAGDRQRRGLAADRRRVAAERQVAGAARADRRQAGAAHGPRRTRSD
jgi:hypothetical protein